MNDDLSLWPKERLIQALEELKDRYNTLVKQNEELVKSNSQVSVMYQAEQAAHANLRTEHQKLKTTKG